MQKCMSRIRNAIAETIPPYDLSIVNQVDNKYDKLINILGKRNTFGILITIRLPTSGGLFVDLLSAGQKWKSARDSEAGSRTKKYILTAMR